MRLRFVGPIPTATTTEYPEHLVTQSYLTAVLASNLSQATVDTTIKNRLASYATVAQVDERDNALATSAFIDTADNTRLAKTTLDKPGGPVLLDTTGKIPVTKTGVGTDKQRFPNATYGMTTGATVTTSGEATVFSMSVPAPNYAYKVMVSGSLHASVALDNAVYPIALVSRDSPSGPIVAAGYGIPDAYQTPQVGSQASRIWISSALKPFERIWTGQFTYTSGWLNFNWGTVNNSTYKTELSGANNMIALSDMTNATLTASVNYTGGELPTAGVGIDNIGRIFGELQIVNSSSGVLVTGPTSTGAGATCTATVTANIRKGDLLTVKGRQNVVAPWGSVFPGNFGTWAPEGISTVNILTVTPSLATGTTTGGITMIPTSLDNQSSIPAGVSTNLYVRILSSGGGTAVTATNFKPFLFAIPIPA